MLRLDSIVKSYGSRKVLEGLSWAIPPHGRVGLVGPNGSGKTTVLKLIAGRVEPDGGRVEMPRDCTLGYLPQEGSTLAAGTVLEAVLAGFPEVAHLESELILAQEAVSGARGDELEERTRRLGDLLHRFETAGGYSLELAARRILTGLGIAPPDHARPLSEMSGGYRMRAALGSLLLRRPDYLLLDEPTNHLDLDGVAWLESFLANIDSALILVSHDRTFLNRLAGSIADLDRGRITVFAGNYDTYRAEKEAARDRQRSAAAQEAHRITEVERFIERFRYKASKARQVQSRVKMLEKMRRTVVAPDERTWRFILPRAPRSPARVLHLEDVRKSFGGKRVIGGERAGVHLDLYRGDRVALVGPNGCGKSTFLKLVAGLLSPDHGDVALGDKVVMHYFAQHVLESLTPGRSVLEEVQAWAPGRKPGELRSMLGIFQFSGDEAFKRVEVLSGGEKSRLTLARLMLDPGNFLVLDEPTNHLDLPAREALEDALAGFDGTLLFVSHDRYFIDKIATRVAGLLDGDLVVHDGGFGAYLSWLEARSAEDSKAPRSGSRTRAAPKDRERRRAEAEKRNERSRLIRACRESVESLEEKISAVESELREIDARQADPATYQDVGKARELGERRKSLAGDQARLTGQWEAALAELERAEEGSS